MSHQSQLQYQVESEEDVSSISIDELAAHGISSTDVQILKAAGINTCDRLLELTKQQVASTGVAKVEKVCEAASNLVKQQSFSSARDVVPKMIVLCDEEVVHTILQEQKFDFVVKLFQKKVGVKIQVQLAVTQCTELSLLKSNVISKDIFLTERCGHNPPISTLECVAKTAKATKYHVAAASDELFNEILFKVPGVSVFNAKNLNNIHFCPGLSKNDMDRSSSEEEAECEQHKKKKLKRGD